jgi:hypothetical protein
MEALVTPAVWKSVMSPVAPAAAWFTMSGTDPTAADVPELIVNAVGVPLAPVLVTVTPDPEVLALESVRVFVLVNVFVVVAAIFPT